MTESGECVDSSLERVRILRSISSTEQKLNYYDTMATTYEKDISLVDYKAPNMAAKTLDTVFPKDRQNVLVLDVACGTGLVVEKPRTLLTQRWPHTSISIDPTVINYRQSTDGSEGMLRVAESKGLYQSLQHHLILPNVQLPLTSDTYDLVIVAGALSNGHLSPYVLPELLRVAKPEAYLCLTANDDKGNNYTQELLVYMEELENKGLWTKVVMQKVDQWQKRAPNNEGSLVYIPGIVVIYRKLSQ
ncbi:methyltransferase-like protein 27 isoform X2 [Pristis pectinata]|uniref:methyltransferase-like protein 27 isoform X2 n=1 Tax=Pristis pectinata TaxID=685728 RepID=UPI00223E04FD|nr:methyltransferase-like protein 27 isoform X2 [Pristis pectinata]